MQTMAPVPVQVTIDSVADGCTELAVGKVLFAIFREDNLEIAHNIRNAYRYLGSGVCNTKNKIVAIYMDGEGNMWGASTVKPDRYFIIKETPI
jgi:hypothetical protein